MAFNHQYYNRVREFVRISIFEYGNNPVMYAEMLPAIIEEQDYESAKAVRDVILEWIDLGYDHSDKVLISQLVGTEI